MTYHATFKENWPFATMILGAGLAVLVAGVRGPSGAPFITAGSVIVGFLLAVRFRCRVRVTPTHLEVRHLVGSSSIRWQDIVNVVSATGLASGPFEVEFQSRESRVRVNFKLFSLACQDDVLSRVPEPALEED